MRYTLSTRQGKARDDRERMMDLGRYASSPSEICALPPPVLACAYCSMAPDPHATLWRAYATAAPDPSRAHALPCARACDAPAVARSAPFHGSSARAAVPVSAAAGGYAPGCLATPRSLLATVDFLAGSAADRGGGRGGIGTIFAGDRRRAVHDATPDGSASGISRDRLVGYDTWDTREMRAP